MRTAGALSWLLADHLGVISRAIIYHPFAA
jgi:hypothetical protein